MLWHVEGQRAFPASDSLHRTEPHSQTYCSLIQMKSEFPWVQWSRHNGFNTLSVYSSILRGSSNRKDIILLKLWCNPCIVHTTKRWLMHQASWSHCGFHNTWLMGDRGQTLQDLPPGWIPTSVRYKLCFLAAPVLFTFSFSTLSFTQGVPVFIGGSLLKGSLTHPWHKQPAWCLSDLLSDHIIVLDNRCWAVWSLGFGSGKS